eukprot:10952317-Lingulodinium_polyedra.AAC.1
MASQVSGTPPGVQSGRGRDARRAPPPVCLPSSFTPASRSRRRDAQTRERGRDVAQTTPQVRFGSS